MAAISSLTALLTSKIRGFVTGCLLPTVSPSTVWRMRRLIQIFACALVWNAFFVSAQEAQNTSKPVPTSQTFALTATKDLVEQGVKAEAVEYLGRKAVRLTAQGEDGFAFVNGTQF